MIKVLIESGFPSIKESGGEVGVHDFLGGGGSLLHILATGRALLRAWTLA